MSEVAIKISNLSKKYKLYEKPIDRLKEVFHPFKRNYHKEFYALKDVSFQADKGEIIGIVGKNGSGKSTLLQIITGVLTPSGGEIKTRGSISALLELGAGFNPELTGIENVFFKSSLLGFSTEETNEKLDEILSFADIGEFVYQPVKTYSSGMFVRLAFAVAINVDPDILIIDEALSVGDYRFQQKCLRKIREFRENNKTILFVSHNTFAIIEFCSRAIWLKDGIVHQVGTPKKVCTDYLSVMAYGDEFESKKGSANSGEQKHGNEVCLDGKADLVDDDSLEWVTVSDCSSFGKGKAGIQAVSFRSAGNNKKIQSFQGGERVHFSIRIKVFEDIESPIVGFHLRDSLGVILLGMNTFIYRKSVGSFCKGDIKTVDFEFFFPFLQTGDYSFSPAVAEGTHNDNIQHHWVHDAYIIQILGDVLLANGPNRYVIKEDVDINVS